MSKSLTELTKEVDDFCADKGWRDDGRTFGDRVALLHSEVSEVLEAYRDWGLADATQKVPERLEDRILPKPEGVGSEYADVLIRLLDDCAVYGIDLEAEYERKMAYNRTRPFRHGGKTL